MASGSVSQRGHRLQQTLQFPPDYRHAGPPTHNDRTWALSAYLGQFLVGIAAPGLVYLLKVRSPFVRRHAAQGLNVGLTTVAVWLVGALLSTIALKLLWIPAIFSLISLVFVIRAAMAANRGGWYRMPKITAWPLIK